MQNKDQFGSILQPLRKRWYYPVAGVLVATLIAMRFLFVATPLYQATTSIKIDDAQAGLTNANLYKDFDIFKINNKIPTEVEVLKSKYLFSKALDKLDFDVEYYRVGNFKTAEVYHDLPIRVDFTIKDSTFYSQTFDLEYRGADKFRLVYSTGGVMKVIDGNFGLPLNDDRINLTVNRDNAFLVRKPRSLDKGKFQFSIYSRTALTNKLMSNNYVVKAIDKDVSIIKIYYQHPVGEKAMRLVNAIAETYIEEGIKNKTDAAAQTVDFVNAQIGKVSEELNKAQDEIETYKHDHGIVNISQETDATLRTLSQLEIQKVQINMDLAALDNLNEYLRKNHSLSAVAPEYQTVVDPLFTEAISALNKHYRDRSELLLKYTEEDGRIIAIDSNIERRKNYINESIMNTRKKLMIRLEEVNVSIAENRAGFSTVPAKESALVALNRNFYLNEKVYNFLIEKRTEAIIARSVSVSFNHILEQADLPRTPNFPQPKMILALAVFLGLLTGIAMAYLRSMMKSNISTREELEKVSTIPFISNIDRISRKDTNTASHFTTLTTKLLMLYESRKNLFITVTSTVRGEGKTFIASNLAKVFAAMDKKVLVVDMNSHHPQMQEIFNVRSDAGIADVFENRTSLHEVVNITSFPNLDVINAGQLRSGINTLLTSSKTKSILQELRQHYDVVIFDTPESGKYMDAIPLMKMSDVNLYVVKANSTRNILLNNAEQIKEEYRLAEVYHVLNNSTEKRNYTGYLSASGFRDKENDFAPKVTGFLKKMNLWF